MEKKPKIWPKRRDTSRRFVSHQVAALWLSGLWSKAEADAAKREVDNKLELLKRLVIDLEKKPKEQVALEVKYEYESVPKEGLTDFEERLAKRRKTKRNAAIA